MRPRLAALLDGRGGVCLALAAVVVQRVLDDPVLRPFLPADFFPHRQRGGRDGRPWPVVHADSLVLAALALLGPALFGSSRRAPPA